jgi:hypothetical protein
MPIAVQGRVEIVDRDEQHVGLWRRGGNCSAADQRDKQEQNAKAPFHFEISPV